MGELREDNVATDMSANANVVSVEERIRLEDSAHKRMQESKKLTKEHIVEIGSFIVVAIAYLSCLIVCVLPSTKDPKFWEGIFSTMTTALLGFLAGKVTTKSK